MNDDLDGADQDPHALAVVVFHALGLLPPGVGLVGTVRDRQDLSGVAKHVLEELVGDCSDFRLLQEWVSCIHH